MCSEDKNTYGSYKAAKTALRQAKHSPTCNERRPIRVYHCSECHGWHLTASPTTSSQLRNHRKRMNRRS